MSSKTNSDYREELIKSIYIVEIKVWKWAELVSLFTCYSLSEREQETH